MPIYLDNILGGGFISGYSGTSGYSGLGFSGAPGPSGFSGYSGLSGYSGSTGTSSNWFPYKVKTTTTSGDPGAGYIIYNTATQTSATQLNISHLTSNNIDIDIFLALLLPTEELTIQDSTSSGNYQKFTITGNLTNVNPGTSNSYWSVPVTLSSSGGTGATNFANDLSVIVALVNGVSGYSGASGYSGVSGAGTSGYSGVSGTSGLSGFSGTSGISGFSGTSGLSGFSGTSGLSGFSGISGFSGSGISGFSGYSGVSGAGTSGFSGYSGNRSPRAITISYPSASENATIFYTTTALTISNVETIVLGSSPSVTYALQTGANRAAFTSNIVNSTTTTSSTTGDTATIANATVLANTFVWVTTSASAAGTTEFHISLSIS